MSSSRAELRSLSPVDRDAVAELARELEADIGYRVATTAADVGDWWSGVDLASDSCAIAAAGRLLAAGWILPRDGVAHQYGLVAPSARGRGHGSRVVEHGEARARELGLARIRAGALGADAAAAELLRRRGYAAANHYLELVLELAAAPAAATPTGIRIAPFRVEDARLFYETIGTAFADNWDFVSTPFEQWYEQRIVNGDMSLSYLARDGDEVAGAIRCDADRRGLGWIAALGVLPAWRSRGIGRALLLHAFRAFWERGQPHVGLGVAADNEPALRLYESVGMQVEAEDVVFEQQLA
jgi:mycothiol synthase